MIYIPGRHHQKDAGFSAYEWEIIESGRPFEMTKWGDIRPKEYTCEPEPPLRYWLRRAKASASAFFGFR